MTWVGLGGSGRAAWLSRRSGISKCPTSYRLARLQNARMQVDIYRRPEANNKFTYLIVPAGEPIPEEATNIDWQARQRDVSVDESAEHLHPYEIDNPRAQIEEKGYAITSVKHQVTAAGNAP
jgi:hypothetical protein